MPNHPAKRRLHRPKGNTATYLNERALKIMQLMVVQLEKKGRRRQGRPREEYTIGDAEMLCKLQARISVEADRERKFKTAKQETLAKMTDEQIAEALAKKQGQSAPLVEVPPLSTGDENGSTQVAS